jgi:excinuclease ABC subunit B
MQYTIDETNRRRAIQSAFNREHGITPRTVISEIKDAMAQHLKASGWEGGETAPGGVLTSAEPEICYHSVEELHREIVALEKKMQEAARLLAFEEAAGYRDRIKELKMMELAVG